MHNSNYPIIIAISGMILQCTKIGTSAARGGIMPLRRA
jgi:hypothetical protein